LHNWGKNEPTNGPADDKKSGEVYSNGVYTIYECSLLILHYSLAFIIHLLQI
jgi:hypothetical protein